MRFRFKSIAAVMLAILMTISLSGCALLGKNPDTPKPTPLETLKRVESLAQSIGAFETDLFQRGQVSQVQHDIFVKAFEPTLAGVSQAVKDVSTRTQTEKGAARVILAILDALPDPVSAGLKALLDGLKALLGVLAGDTPADYPIPIVS